tara:strand:+ start:525 stop:1073 length:549 start_codon:yes stop_codon:yes gene_type:complete
MSVYIKKDNKGKKKIDTPTPHELCQQIANIILEHYEVNNILDPCCGDCRLSKPFTNTKVINYEIKDGTDFLEVEKIDEAIDLVIMNPPFNLGTGKKLAVEVFMDKVLELVGKDVPIVLITPMGFRLNQRKKSARWKKLRDNYPPITSILSLPLDCFDKTLFHCEVLFFNLKRLEPHYFIDYI